MNCSGANEDEPAYISANTFLTYSLANSITSGNFPTQHINFIPKQNNSLDFQIKDINENSQILIFDELYNHTKNKSIKSTFEQVKQIISKNKNVKLLKFNIEKLSAKPKERFTLIINPRQTALHKKIDELQKQIAGKESGIIPELAEIQPTVTADLQARLNLLVDRISDFVEKHRQCTRKGTRNQIITNIQIQDMLLYYLVYTWEHFYIGIDIPQLNQLTTDPILKCFFDELEYYKKLHVIAHKWDALELALQRIPKSGGVND
jgi:hypothetical protein